MKYFLYIFLFLGFIINFFNSIEYFVNIKNIIHFEKLVSELKETISTNKDSNKVNKLFYEILETYEIYINSNINFVFYPNLVLKQNLLVTAHWTANFRRYFCSKYLVNDFSKNEEYTFEKLLEYMQLTLDECHISKGKNRYAIRKSLVNFIPLFYFRNCIDFFISQFPVGDEEVPQKNNRWVNFAEIISILANVATLTPFIFSLFGIKI